MREHYLSVVLQMQIDSTRVSVTGIKASPGSPTVSVVLQMYINRQVDMWGQVMNGSTPTLDAATITGVMLGATTITGFKFETKKSLIRN